METIFNKVPMDIPKDIWCGWELNKWQKRMLTDLTLKEFEKFPKKRKTPEDLVKTIFSSGFIKLRNEYEKNQ